MSVGERYESQDKRDKDEIPYWEVLGGTTGR